jgi:hypothetical protein
MQASRLLGLAPQALRDIRSGTPLFILGGWGRGVWGQGSWGQSLGLQATGEIGSVEVQEGVGVYVTGVQATQPLATLRLTADGAIEALGNAATGEIRYGNS